jgi:hypothetical protein
MVNRVIKGFAQDGLTVTHLKKGLTTAHLQQAMGGIKQTADAPVAPNTASPGSGSGGSSGIASSPSSGSAQITGRPGSKSM